MLSFTVTNLPFCLVDFLAFLFIEQF